VQWPGKEMPFDCSTSTRIVKSNFAEWNLLLHLLALEFILDHRLAGYHGGVVEWSERADCTYVFPVHTRGND